MTLKGNDEPKRLFEPDERHEGAASVAAAALESRVGLDPGPGDWLELTGGLVVGYEGVALDDSAPPGGAPAMLLLSMLSHLVGSVPGREPPRDGFVMGINYGFDRVRFGEPVAVGSRVRARSVVRDVTRRGAAVHMTSDVTVQVDGRDEPALQAQWIVRAEYSD